MLHASLAFPCYSQSIPVVHLADTIFTNGHNINRPLPLPDSDHLGAGSLRLRGPGLAVLTGSAPHPGPGVKIPAVISHQAVLLRGGGHRGHQGEAGDWGQGPRSVLAATAKRLSLSDL